MEETTLDPFERLEAELRRAGCDLDGGDWSELKAECSVVQFPRRAEIFPIGIVPREILFVASGVAAATFLTEDGTIFIYRFFEPGHLCTAITSAWRREPTADAVVAATDVRGLLLPLECWRRHYSREGALGNYFREKLVETLLFDKDIILTKTSKSTEAAYSLLEAQQPGVLRQVP
ncbi:MAG: cyclic nucleotide-binding domain-containing protein, partial [Acidobacteriota bacterium]